MTPEEELNYQMECIEEVLDFYEYTAMELINDFTIAIHFLFLNLGIDQLMEALDNLKVEDQMAFKVCADIHRKFYELENRHD